jgi:hypothetical protein
MDGLPRQALCAERGPRRRDVVRLGEEAHVPVREVDESEPGPWGGLALP